MFQERESILHILQILSSWNISRKFLLMLFVFLLPASTIIVLSGLDHRKNEIAMAENNAMLLVHSIAAQQEQVAIGTEQMFSTLAQLPEVQGLDEDACNKLFHELHRQYPFYTAIGATTPAGDVFAISPPIKSGTFNLSDRKHIRDAKETLAFSSGEYIVGRVSLLPSLNYAYPVLDTNKKLVAILQAGFNLKKYANFMTKANLPEGYAMSIADINGVRLYRFPESDATPPGKPFTVDVLSFMQSDSDQGIFEKTGEDGTDRIYAFKRLHLGANTAPYLYIAVGMPRDRILQKANHEMLSSLSILGVAAFLSMCFAWLFGNLTLVKPIEHLVTATKRFAEGLMDTRTGLAHTPDELGQLAKSFDDMASLLEMRNIERKKAEDELRESKEFLNLIIENIPDMIFLKDAAELRFIRINKAAEELLGYSREALIGKTVSELFSPREADLLTANDRMTLQNKQLLDFPEIRIQTRHRGERIVHTKKIPVLNSEGEPQFLLGIAADITEHKRAEEYLQKSQEQFRTLVENAPDAIFVQANGCFAYVNEAAVRLYGATSEDELLGKSVMDRFHPESHPRVLERIRTITKERKPVPTMEQKHVRLDGTTIYVEVHSVPIVYRGEHGGLVFVRDVTERKQTEETLQRTEERYSRLFEDAVLGIFRSTPDGKLIKVNPAYAAMFGYGSPEETVRRVNNVAIDLYVNASHREEIIRMILETEGSVRVETVYKRRDNSTFAANLHARAVRDRDGNFLYMEGFVEDISERKRAEQERQLLEGRLRQSHKMEAIGTLAGGIAHDFNNILAAIIGYTEMSLDDISDYNEVRHNLEQILKSGLRARDLVRQILVFSRMQVGQSLQPIEIGMVINEALRFLRASFPTTIEIRQSIQGQEGVALADSTQVHQLITNLCTNALHAMEETGGVLDVSLTSMDLAPASLPQYQNLTAGPYLRLTVSDTGIGMEASTLERIFDPYFTTKAPAKGSGLGLAMVHGIVKRHKGAIEVRSEPGRGSSFHIYLPKIQSKAAGEVQEPSELLRGTETILLIDDEEALVDVGQKMLQSLGYEVTIKTSSTEALKLFAERPDSFDLVITDYTMPRMTGSDLAREMIRIRPDIPIILSTGFTERITPEKANELGIREFLMKPLSIRELARVVRRSLDNVKQNSS
jgi:two-component system, cell cycle sensor histidine kinase and response regulator CckA